MNTEKNEGVGELTHRKRNLSTIKLNLYLILMVALYVLAITFFKTHDQFPLISLVLSCAYLLFGFFFIWKWYTSLDEFEQGLLNKSCFYALMSGFGISIIWTVLKEHDFVNYELHSIWLILIMWTISSIYYYGKKFLDR